ncbi:hypothetical protein POM88_049489 [Heracleum sosnowskyi]|uniref:Uncharacterized protein n=1 Tax=Heracleum sosnowskyi TaxID=360622 RepID=A0AAD8GYA4_9APIA|nr:hypothetical protein POM88_049489 [Heracleum sosnowskyi]
MSKAYDRRKRSKTTGVAQRTHRMQTTASSCVSTPSQIQFDVAPVNVESQPHSLNIQIETEIPSSPTLSVDVDMIHTSIPDSPSLKFLEKPHSEIGGHHLLDDLLDHQSILSETLVPYVELNLKSISTDSAIVSISKAAPSTLELQTSNITTSSVDELVVVQTLLGLREGSDGTESE